MKSGEFDHKTDQPFLNFLSGLLDITIVKPLIEAFTGYDIITGEDLTDLEKGLKVVFAVVDAATLGQAIAATQALKLSGKLTAKEFSSVLLKTIGLELGSNAAGYTAGYISSELGLPLPITLALAGGAGIAVSKLGGKYLFKTADGLSVEWEPPKGTKPEALQALDDAAAGRGLDEALEGVVNPNILSDQMAEEYAFQAIKGGDRSDGVMLGKYQKGTKTSYDALAREYDCQYFNLENYDELASKYTKDEIWKINQKFLDIETSSGRDIYLSHNPADFLGDGSFFSQEIQYLVDAGYKFVKEGDIWHAIR